MEYDAEAWILVEWNDERNMDVLWSGQWGIRDDSYDGFCITKSRALWNFDKWSWGIQFVNYYWIDCLNDALEIKQQLNLQVSTSIVDPFYLFND